MSDAADGRQENGMLCGSPKTYERPVADEWFVKRGARNSEKACQTHLVWTTALCPAALQEVDWEPSGIPSGPVTARPIPRNEACLSPVTAVRCLETKTSPDGRNGIRTVTTHGDTLQHPFRGIGLLVVRQRRGRRVGGGNYRGDHRSM